MARLNLLVLLSDAEDAAGFKSGWNSAFTKLGLWITIRADGVSFFLCVFEMDNENKMCLHPSMAGWQTNWLGCRLVGCLVCVFFLVRDDEQCLETRLWELSDYTAEQFDKPALQRKLMSLMCLYLCLSFHFLSLILLTAIFDQFLCLFWWLSITPRNRAESFTMAQNISWLCLRRNFSRYDTIFFYTRQRFKQWLITITILLQ